MIENYNGPLKLQFGLVCNRVFFWKKWSPGSV